MTLDDIIALAHSHMNSESVQLATIDQCARTAAFWTLVDIASQAIATRASLASAISDLLAEGAPCGFEQPTVNEAPWAGLITVPDSWAGPTAPPVSPADARAMARMLLRAADESETP